MDRLRDAARSSAGAATAGGLAYERACCDDETCGICDAAVDGGETVGSGRGGRGDGDDAGGRSGGARGGGSEGAEGRSLPCGAGESG